MLTRAKRARLEKTTFRWLDLESGVWEQIFCHLKGADLRNARQVCSEFYSDASRTIRCLEIGSAYEASEVVPAGEEAIEEQVQRFAVLQLEKNAYDSPILPSSVQSRLLLLCKAGSIAVQICNS